MKFLQAEPGMTKIGGDFCYPLPRLRHDFEAIKAECHRYGLKFYSGENRLRAMGDSMTCCGIDGLPGFRPNEYNLCMLMNGKNPEPTEEMKEVGNRRTVQDAEPERGQRAQNCKAELLRPDAGGARQKDRLPQKGVWTG